MEKYRQMKKFFLHLRLDLTVPEKYSREPIRCTLNLLKHRWDISTPSRGDSKRRNFPFSQEKNVKEKQTAEEETSKSDKTFFCENYD
jgi:hypothetical protein